MKKKKGATPKSRNWIAVAAHFRRAHTSANRKKKNSKEACRKWKTFGEHS